MVRAYQRYDIDCVVDIYAPPCPDPSGDGLIAELGILRIILLPSLETCLERNRQRAREPVLQDSHLVANYAGFVGCVAAHQPPNVIDNGDLNAGQTVELIERMISS